MSVAVCEFVANRWNVALKSDRCPSKFHEHLVYSRIHVSLLVYLCEYTEKLACSLCIVGAQLDISNDFLFIFSSMAIVIRFGCKIHFLFRDVEDVCDESTISSFTFSLDAADYYSYAHVEVGILRSVH